MGLSNLRWNWTSCDDVGCTVTYRKDNNDNESSSPSSLMSIVLFNECDHVVWVRGDYPMMDATKQYYWEMDFFPLQQQQKHEERNVLLGVIKTTNIHDWCNRHRDHDTLLYNNLRLENTKSYLYIPLKINDNDKIGIHLDPVNETVSVYINGNVEMQFVNILPMNEYVPYYPVVGVINRRMGMRMKWNKID